MAHSSSSRPVVEKILQFLPGPALADQGVLEPSGHERMRTAAILRGCGAPACDAHRVHQLGIQGQGGLDAQVVHPQIAEVVFVGESLKAPQLQLADQDFMCLGVEEHAALLMDTVLATANLEAMKVHVLPAERDLPGSRAPSPAWASASGTRCAAWLRAASSALRRGPKLDQGQRPHINFHGIRYTNAVLASTAGLLGQTLRIYYNSQDLRTVRAFAADGAEIGVLKAQGAWGEILHDLKLRQEVLRLRGRKRLGGANSQELSGDLRQRQAAKAKGSRRAASDAARTLRTLAAQPTSFRIAGVPP